MGENGRFVRALLKPSEPPSGSSTKSARLERRAALVLAILAVIAGIVTYVVTSGWPLPRSSVRSVLILLNIDLILLLCLGVIVARRIARLIVERRQGSAGSKLHTKLVAMFAVLAATPAIIVAIFSVVFLSSGLEHWFSSRIRDALENSLAVAEAYLDEHKEVIRADAVAMAADLDREGPAVLQDPDYLRHLVVAQAALRSLTEAIVFDGTGKVLAHSGLGIALEIEQLSPDDLSRAAQGEVVTMTNSSDDRVRALLRLDALGDVYLFVGRFVDAQVLGFMERTQEIVAEYRNLESERSGIQITSALVFAIVAILLLLAAVWVGLHLADHLVRPISRLIGATDLVSRGDLSVRVPETAEEDEVDQLSRAFNRMTSQLQSQRRELVVANEKLDERRRFTETVLAGVTAGVIGLNRERQVLLPNRSATEILGIAGTPVEGRAIDGLIPAIAPLFDRLLEDHDHIVQDHLSLRRGDRERMLLVRVAAQLEAEMIMGYVVTFDDVTELMSAQRQAAWSELARRIAHEIKNPLTPIRLAAERLTRRYQKDIPGPDQESFARSVQTIISQVDVIGRLVGEFSAFARMPPPIFKLQSLSELVRNAVLLQQSAWQTVNIELEEPVGDPLIIPCDSEKVGQVLTNLLQNSINALLEQPAERREPMTVLVRTSRQANVVTVLIQDNGPGFPAGERERLFEPYFTTRAKGTGLGLAIVRKIMEEHRGRVELDNAPSGGAVVLLSFPAAEDVSQSDKAGAAKLEPGAKNTDRPMQMVE